MSVQFTQVLREHLWIIDSVLKQATSDSIEILSNEYFQISSWSAQKLNHVYYYYYYYCMGKSGVAGKYAS